MTKPIVFQVTDYDVGRNGITRRDVGRWCVIVCGAIHFRDTEAEAREMARFISE